MGKHMMREGTAGRGRGTAGIPAGGLRTAGRGGGTAGSVWGLVLGVTLFVAGCATAGPRALVETSWHLAAINGEPLPALPQPLTLEFSAGDFRASGNSGCNQFSGPYTLEGEMLSFGAIISTKRACIDESANAREAQYLGLLGGVSRYTRNGDELHLFAGDREVLEFRRAP